MEHVTGLFLFETRIDGRHFYRGVAVGIEHHVGFPVLLVVQSVVRRVFTSLPPAGVASNAYRSLVKLPM
jgi:hypothetical protein